MNWKTEWMEHRTRHARVYAEFAVEINTPPNGFCWACGRTNLFRDKPQDFHGLWIIHRAHIVSSPRMEDRRVINSLCPLCHHDYDGNSGKLTLENMIFLKSLFDPEWFDLDFMQKCSIRILPGGQELSADYVAAFQARHNVLTRGPVRF